MILWHYKNLGKSRFMGEGETVIHTELCHSDLQLVRTLLSKPAHIITVSNKDKVIALKSGAKTNK